MPPRRVEGAQILNSGIIISSKKILEDNPWSAFDNLVNVLIFIGIFVPPVAIAGGIVKAGYKFYKEWIKKEKPEPSKELKAIQQVAAGLTENRKVIMAQTVVLHELNIKIEDLFNLQNFQLSWVRLTDQMDNRVDDIWSKFKEVSDKEDKITLLTQEVNIDFIESKNEEILSECDNANRGLDKLIDFATGDIQFRTAWNICDTYFYKKDSD